MIQNLLSHPESKTLEFKRDLSSPKPLLKTLVAFANSAGGKLVIGVENMKQGVSQIRNSVIVRVFRELDMMEQWGSGIPSAFREAEKLGLPPLQIQEVALRLRFIVPLHEPIVLKTRTTAEPRAQSGAQSEAPVEAPVILSETERKILDMITNPPLGRKEIVELLGYRQPTGNYKSAIDKLLKVNLIEYTLPEKPQSRLQKYRITAKGRALL